ncbi:MAG: CinA family nicotinamide mononucleotide deamidase-related protein [Candidatus Abyssobacteria bacterium SURF_5]|uniref:CinA-like protein n=1 Tax=Abyssobacteria bacterium (strain SURF_5) TaxID=2093360 RepID=A0A3A4NXG7_ABYX5|nr:MAG: CinA family nicotinamide mononucleotide deamidase-related protein [Candidatus Abyssubacteria bacterium SURF_5]
MNAEIIMIGSELLLGQIIDTNSAFLAQELAKIGVNLYFKTTVGDNPVRMADVFRAALSRSDIIIASGGLGPTEDDLTREVVAEVIGEPLEFRQDLFDQIESLFKRHGFTMSPNNRKQAFIPRNSQAIENPVGTAPGFIVEKQGRLIVTLPGVPRELKFLMETVVIPFLRARFSLGETTIASRVLKICGMGESRVDSVVGDLIRESSNPTVGILAEPAQILLRITAKGASPSEAKAKIAAVEAEIRNRLGRLIFGTDAETLEGVVTALLVKDKKSVALVETLTGGAIAQGFVSAGGSTLTESFVALGDEARRRMASIDVAEWNEARRNPAAVSKRLAEGMRAKSGADIAAASLGILPGSDELEGDDKVSGKTCIAVASESTSTAWEFRFAGSDPVNQVRATALTIEMLRRFLIGYVDDEMRARMK